MWRASITVLLLLVPWLGRAQRLNIEIAPRSRVDVSMQILDEGSYILQRSAFLGGWSSISNFNALPGTFEIREPRDSPRQFYRMVRQQEMPAITAQPAGTNSIPGRQLQLVSGAAGSWPLRLQWYKGITLLANETNSTLTLAGAVSDSGNYAMLASNQWGIALSSPAVVQIVSPVPETVGGRSIQFLIQSGRAPLAASGNYTMNCDPSGFYTINGSSILLNDTGYWHYTRWDGVTSYIQTPGSILYPSGSFRLTFDAPGTGVFLLTVPGSSGFQSGRFTFLN